MCKESYILPDTPDRIKQQLALGLTHVEINYGCPGRICAICNYNSPLMPLEKPGPALDFRVIQQIHRLPSPQGPFSRYIFYHFVGEPFGYWYEDKVGKDRYTFADVVEDALRSQVVPCAMTHGILPNDHHGIQTVLTLTRFFETFPGMRDMFELGFSIDPYGFVGMDRKEYEEIVKWNLDLFGILRPRIIGYYNPNDPEGIGGRASLKDLLDRVLPHTYRRKGNIDQLPIFSLGRAAHINPPPIPWRNEDYTRGTGYIIRYTGEIQLNVHGLNSDHITQGSIYQRVDRLDPVK